MLKNYFVSIIYAFLLILLSGCSLEGKIKDVTVDSKSESLAQEEILASSLDALVLQNISYGNHPEQIYDLYLPKGRSSASTKVLVLVHGGGWRSGDNTNMAEYVNYFLENQPNYAILNLNYTLAVQDSIHAFPNQYLDIKMALQQISNQSESQQILPEFGLLGSSAGAHLAMMYDYIHDTSNQVKFVANIVGPTDLNDPFFTEQDNFEDLVNLLVDKNQYHPDADVVLLNSPAHKVNASSSPTLLFYGNQDPLIPLSNGLTLAHSLSTWDIDHRFTIYDGGHGITTWSEANKADMFSKINDFIDAYLSTD